MKIKKVRRKIITTGVVTGVLLVATTLPSYAINLNINQSLNKVIGQLNGYFKGIYTAVEEEINTNWGNLQKDAGAAISKAEGDLGMPDPTGASKELAAKVKLNGGIANETSTTIGAVEAGKELERATTRASVKSVLGVEGQARTLADINATSETMNSAQQLADSAQNATSSQDVLKALAAQNAQIVSMLGQQRTDALQQRNDVQHTNLMLGQIAENGAEQNRTQRILANGATSQFLEISGWSRLDSTYVTKKQQTENQKQ